MICILKPCQMFFSRVSLLWCTDYIFKCTMNSYREVYPSHFLCKQIVYLMTFHHAFRYQQIIQPVFTDFDVKKKKISFRPSERIQQERITVFDFFICGIFFCETCRQEAIISTAHISVRSADIQKELPVPELSNALH